MGDAVKLALDQLFLLGLLSAVIHWLGARSEIARPLWSRARGWLDKLLRCPACSGFWLGGLVTWGGVHPFSDMPRWQEIVGGALCGVILTPVFEAVLLWALERTAIAAIEDARVTGAETIDESNPVLTESGEVTPNERPHG